MKGLFWLLITFLLLSTTMAYARSQEPIPSKTAASQSKEHITDEQLSKANSKQAPPSMTSSPVVEPHAQAESQEKHEVPSNQKNNTPSAWWSLPLSDILQLGFDFFLVLFTGLLWRSTYKMWKATNNSVLIATDTAQRELRPYVYLETRATQYPPSPAEYNRFSISLVMTNTGKTWAKNLRVVAAVIPQELSYGRDPFDLLEWGKHATKPTTLGPSQTVPMQFRDVLRSEVPAIATGKSGYDFVAWVKYEDSVSLPFTVWQTQLSQHLNADVEGGISFTMRPTHNCVDEDCTEPDEQTSPTHRCPLGT